MGRLNLISYSYFHNASVAAFDFHNIKIFSEAFSCFIKSPYEFPKASAVYLKIHPILFKFIIYKRRSNSRKKAVHQKMRGNPYKKTLVFFRIKYFDFHKSLHKNADYVALVTFDLHYITHNTFFNHFKNFRKVNSF